MVALRKESVDRNMAFCVDYLKSTWSLSARRAWIEIETPQTNSQTRTTSLSARRAWIEIVVSMALDQYLKVALRKESVDRNRNTPNKLTNAHRSLSARRAWIEISFRNVHNN